MMIRFDSISYTYPSGVQALDDVSLNIESGEILAIVGENGAGKSTLVKQLNGLLRPASGQTFIDDQDTSQFTTAQLAKKVAFLFQNPDEQLFERTIFREVAFGPRNLGLDDSHVEQRVHNALQSVGLEDEIDSHPYDLPYTKRKLIALAATLALETPILVLDEPTVGQDAVVQSVIGDILRDLHAQGRTQIIITHDLDFCSEISERVIVMGAGKILADGPSQAVLTQTPILNQAAVDPPQIVRLAQALNMPIAPLTISRFVEEYTLWIRDKR